MKTVTVFKGDGIGPEITDAVLKILKAAKAPLSYEIYQVGLPLYEQSGELVSEEAFASFERTRVLLKSPITTPVGSGFRSINVMLRKKYDLYANVRPARSNPAIVTPFKDVDIVTFRENTEDLYVGVEEQIDENTVHATKIITRSASERIIRDYGMEAYARKFEQFVAFGPEFPHSEKTTDAFVGGPHQRDEGIKIDDLLRAMAIYAAALETLAA